MQQSGSQDNSDLNLNVLTISNFYKNTDQSDSNQNAHPSQLKNLKNLNDIALMNRSFTPFEDFQNN